jgi:predicted transcriptional regulator
VAKFKTPSDPRGGHVRLYWEVVDSNAWRCLSASDQRVYVALLRGLRSTNNGDLSLPLSAAKHFGISSKTTLAKSLRALMAVGLIAVTRKGGATKGGQRLPSLYRITDQPVFEMPAKHIEASKATNEWKAITTLAMGRQAIKRAEEAAKAEAQKTETQGQKMTHTGSEIGPVESLTGSKNGPWPAGPGQKMTLANIAKSASEPATAQVSA